MPMLQISTNVDQSVFDEPFLKEATTSLSKLLGKPESFVMVVVSGNTQMSFGGSTQPTALVTLESIGGICETKNAEYSSEIFRLLQSKGIESNRMFIKFVGLERSNVAWNGKLFSQ